MSADRVTYLDASAIVKLAVLEEDSTALCRYVTRQRTLVSSALARTEVGRALLPSGARAVARGEDALETLELVGLSQRVLKRAAELLPAELRTLDAIHLATAHLMGSSLARLVTYDDRMAEAARGLGLTVVSPG